MPGIRELLDALESATTSSLGLLTGNLVAGARAKLGAVGIDPDRFRVGAYGSDHETARRAAGGRAAARARGARASTSPGRDVVVIGDTPADIDCGRAIGARAIGVATGHYSVDELREHRAGRGFEDLSDTDGVVRAISRR